MIWSCEQVRLGSQYHVAGTGESTRKEMRRGWEEPCSLVPWTALCHDGICMRRPRRDPDPLRRFEARMIVASLTGDSADFPLATSRTTVRRRTVQRAANGKQAARASPDRICDDQPSPSFPAQRDGSLPGKIKSRYGQGRCPALFLDRAWHSPHYPTSLLSGC